MNTPPLPARHQPARPDTHRDVEPTAGPPAWVLSGLPQSLADGVLGEALLAVELALTGDGSWDQVSDALARAHASETVAGDVPARAGLFYGAPALAFVLDAAGADDQARYAGRLAEVDRQVEALAWERLVVAGERRAALMAPPVGEFDLLEGLVGLGAVLLRRVPHSRVVGKIVEHVVNLTVDRRLGGVLVPGWWTTADRFALQDGHAALGMVDGAAGLLAFLAAAVGAGREKDVPRSALESLVGWLTRWRQDGPDGPWWPARLTLDELRAGATTHPDPQVPGWAGTVGIGRALQMAAIVTGDTDLREQAEAVIGSCLTPTRSAQVTGHGLWGGTAGLYQTVFRAARDASSSLLPHRLPTAAQALAQMKGGWPRETGLLTGRTGVRLANTSRFRLGEPASGWDRVLLIAWANS